MGRKERESRNRASRKKSRNVDQVLSNADETKTSSSDRYHIALSESTRTDDSSRAHGSELGSEPSQQYTTEEEESTVGSSYDTESELSSIIEQVETEELLENDEIFSAASYDSRPGMVGGWFDFACGWMDRPNMCVGVLGGGKQTSLLRESHMKAEKAMRRVKMNESMKRAAKEASETKKKKDKSEVEKLQRGVARAAAVAAESVRKLEIQPSKSSSTLQDDNDADPKTMKVDDSEKTSEMLRQEDIEEKMKQVSARAAEILKNTIEARALKPRDDVSISVALYTYVLFIRLLTMAIISQHDSSPTQSYGNLRQKLIDKLTQHEATSPADEDSAEEPKTVVHDAKASMHHESVERSSRSTHSIVRRGGQDITIVEGDIVDVEELSGTSDVARPDQVDAIPVQIADNDTSHQVLSEAHKSLEDVPPVVPASHSITDLTYFDDGNGELEDASEQETTVTPEPAELSLPQKPVAVVPPKRSTRLASLQKNDLGKKEMEVIDVFEIDDEDSWTPGEKNDPPPLSIHQQGHSPSKSHSDELAQDKSPPKSMRASLFEAKVSNAVERPDDVINLWEGSGHVSRSRSHRTRKDETFNDPQAREAFAGLRRGRLETKGKPHDRTSQSGLDALDGAPVGAPMKNEPIVIGTDGHVIQERDVIIEAEMALRRARSRDSRRMLEQSMEHRRLADDSHRAKNIVAIRSIDEAQRIRSERSRDFHDVSAHGSKGRELRGSFSYGHHERVPSHDSPIDADEYMQSRTRDYDDDISRRSTNERGRYSGPAREKLDYRPQRHTFSAPVPSYHEHDHSARRQFIGREQSQVDRYSPISREPEMYNSVNITRPKSRERSYAAMEMQMSRSGHRRSMDGKDMRSRDMRDDNDFGRSEASGHGRYDEFEDSASRRRSRTNPTEESHHIKELRRLEKKITKQLQQVKQSQQIPEEWDERSAVSRHELRSLEKKLVQTLRKEDEKRAAKLQRIKHKLTSRKSATEMMDPPARQPMATEKLAEPQDGRYNYGQMKALRQSRPMHKYMQRTGVRTGKQFASPEAEEY